MTPLHLRKSIGLSPLRLGFVLISFVFGLFASVASGVTERWSYTIPEDGQIVYTVVDNYGGVALLWQGPPPQYNQEGVIWLNRDGTELYTSQTYDSSNGIWIVGVEPQELVFSTQNGSAAPIVVVGRDGTETMVTGNLQFPFYDYFQVCR